MVDLDKLWSYSGLNRLKTDQVSPVSIFVWPRRRSSAYVRTHIKARKTATTGGKITAIAAVAAAAAVT